MPLRPGLADDDAIGTTPIDAISDVVPSAPVTGTSVAVLTAGGLLFHILLKARGLVVVPLYARLLPPDALGVVMLGAALAGLIAPLLHLGLPTGLLVELPHRPAGEAAARGLRASLAVIAIAGLAACIVLPGAVRWGPWPSLGPLAPYALAVGAFAAGMALREAGQIVPQLRRQVRFLAGIGIGVEYGGVTLGLLLVLFGWGPGGLLWGLAIATLAGATAAIRRSLVLVGPGRGLDLDFVRSALALGLPMMALTTAQWVVQSADRFFLAHYGGAATVGVYAIGYSVASAVLALAAALNLVFLPVAANLLRSAPHRLVRFVDESVRLAVVLLGLAVAGAFVVGAPVMRRLGGAAYAAAGGVLPYMVVAYALFTIVQLLQWVPMAVARRVRGVVGIHATMAGVNLALDFVLVRTLGMLGAVLAAVAAYVIGVALMAMAARRVLPAWRPASAVPALLLAALGGAVGAMVRLPAEASLGAIGVAALTVVIAYSASGLAVGAVRRDDLILLREALAAGTSRLRS